MTISFLETVGAFHVLFIYWDVAGRTGWYRMGLGAEMTDESNVRAQGPFKEARGHSSRAGWNEVVLRSQQSG